MKIGISSACLYPLPTEDAVQKVLRLGVEQIEIFLCSPSETELDFIKSIRRISDYHRAQVVAIHPWSSAFEPLFFFSGYKRRIKDGIELYKKYFEAAAMVGAGHVVFHGDRKDKKFSHERYFEVFNTLAKTANTFGVHLAQENVGYCKSGNLSFIKEMKTALPDTKFVLDIKQCKRADVNPIEMADAMGDGILALHLSDHDDVHECLLPGSGKFDFSLFFDKLKEQDVFDIPALIELYSDNYNRKSQLKDAICYLNRLI